MSFFRMRTWLVSPQFSIAMVRLGPITRHCRAFLCPSSNSGTTKVTAGFNGIVVRELPSIGLRTVYKLETLAFRDELRMYFPKFYRFTRRDNIRGHPAFSISSKPLLMILELLCRCEDARIQRRTCNFTKVRVFSSKVLVLFHFLDFHLVF